MKARYNGISIVMEFKGNIHLINGFGGVKGEKKRGKGKKLSLSKERFDM